MPGKTLNFKIEGPTGRVFNASVGPDDSGYIEERNARSSSSYAKTEDAKATRKPVSWRAGLFSDLNGQPWRFSRAMIDPAWAGVDLKKALR